MWLNGDNEIRIWDAIGMQLGYIIPNYSYQLWDLIVI